MSRTKIHIHLGKYNNGLLDEIPINLMKKFNRNNFDIDIFRAEKKHKVEKQAEKDMNIELTEYNNEHF